MNVGDLVVVGPGKLGKIVRVILEADRVLFDVDIAGVEVRVAATAALVCSSRSQARRIATQVRERKCVRWGSGPDRCVRLYDHLGACQDAQGNTTLTLAAKYLGREV